MVDRAITEYDTAEHGTRVDVRAARALAFAAASCTAFVLLAGPRVSLWLVITVYVAGSVSLAALVVSPRRREALSRRFVLTVSLLVLVIAVLTPPRGTTDIWSYSAYGRMVVHDHVSPYRAQPGDFPHDPVEQRVIGRWRRTPSLYGPGFTAVSAVESAVTGTSRTATRFWYQGMTLLAALAVLLLLTKTGAPAVALAAFGLHPLTAALVNGGLNDLLVGLAVLGGALFAQRRRPVAAGLVLAVGALVKVGGLLPLAGVALWVWWRHGRRAAAQLLGTAASALVVCFAAAGGIAALAPLQRGTHLWSRAALWNPLREWTLQALDVAGVHHVDPVQVAGVIGRVATGVVLAVSAFVLLGHRRRLDAAGAAAVGPLVYTVGAAYALPRYAGWGLPAAALGWRSGHARLLLVWSAFVQMLYMQPVATKASMLGRVDRGVLPLIELGVLVALLVVAGRERRRAPHSPAFELPTPG